MSQRRAVRLLALAIFTLIVFISTTWAGSARPSAGRAKARVLAGAHLPRTGSRVASKRRPVVKKGRAKTTRASRRRGKRRYRQAWTASTCADSGSGDVTAGEDAVVRSAAVNALGPLNGSIVVVDPSNGRILSMVNQPVVLGSGYTPCSTIKLPVALAALHEGIITKDTAVKLGRRWSLNLTDALATSNNPYFETLGRRIGFTKLRQYAREFGFGERAGYQIEGEQLGEFPPAPPSKGGVGRMCSFGEEISVTPLQLAAFVSSIANGGTLFYLQYPRTKEELDAFEPRVKRELDVKALLPGIREGMLEAVAHGTAKRLFNPYAEVLGKTGTCSEGGTRLGWFASYENQPNPRLAVIVLLRGGRPTVGPLAAEVAGRVYRNLHEQNYYARQELPAQPRGALVPAAGLLTR